MYMKIWMYITTCICIYNMNDCARTRVIRVSLYQCVSIRVRILVYLENV